MVYKETLSKNYGDRMGIERVLFDAVISGRYKYLKRLLLSGVAPNVIDENNRSLLIHACHIQDDQKRLKFVRLLLRHKIVSKTRDVDNMDALMHATVMGYSNILEDLILDCCDSLDLKCRNRDGFPLLTLAVISKDETTLGTIVTLHNKLGLHVDDVTDTHGLTPYMEAKKRGLTQMHQYLLIHGNASPLRVNSDGKTVHNLAFEYQKAREKSLEFRVREQRLINPPRYSVINSKENVSKDVAFFQGGNVFSRESTLATEDIDAVLGTLYRKPKPKVQFSSGRASVTRNQDFIFEFQPRIDSYNKNAKENTSPLKRSTSVGSVMDSIPDLFDIKRDSLSALYAPSFDNARVELEADQMARLKAEIKRNKKRGLQNKPVHRHAGYNILIPDSIQKKLDTRREVSFAFRRASEHSRRNQIVV